MQNVVMALFISCISFGGMIKIWFMWEKIVVRNTFVTMIRCGVFMAFAAFLYAASRRWNFCRGAW